MEDSACCNQRVAEFDAVAFTELTQVLAGLAAYLGVDRHTDQGSKEIL